MPELSQSNRPLRVTLGDVDPDGLVITSLNGSEGISRLYSYTLTVAAPVDAPIKFADVLGKPALIQMDQGVLGGDTRYIHGMVSRFGQGVRDDRYIWYRAEVVPALWLLTRFTRSRTKFQQMTVKEILADVIGELYSPRFDLTEDYAPRNYCVQYRETDFAFISRLMEEEGIFYYFTHTADGQELVIADNADAHDPVPDPSPLIFQDEGNATPSEGRIQRWDKTQEVRAGKLAITEHHFEMPPQDFNAPDTTADTLTVGTVDHALVVEVAKTMTTVDHPGGFAHFRDGIDQGGGDRAADLDPLFTQNARMAMVQLGQQMASVVEIEGDGTYCRIVPGHKFTLAEHFDADGDYLVTAVRHAASCSAPDSAAQGDYKYTNRFTCTPIKLVFRPARVTPWPFIRGTQTGTVVGEDGAEIDPDKYGRVKVLFHWDPEGNRNLDTSCWVRVAQFWAGRQWGSQFIPRVGDEVVVSFEDGDPDRPLIIGSVYNADNMPIYKLPDNKTQSGIKTTSSKKGTTQNFNELRFEDKKGGELVHIQAEKDMSITVEDNYTVGIGAHQKDPAKAGKSSTTVFGDTSYTVSKGNYNFDVQTGTSTTHVKGRVSETYDADHFITVQSGQVTTINSKDHHVVVTSGHAVLKIDGGNRFVNVSGFYQMVAGGAIDLDSGDLFEATAKNKILLQTGGASIEMLSDGTINITGTKVTINGSNFVKVVGGGADTEWKGSKIAENGPGGVAVTGATIKLNS